MKSIIASKTFWLNIVGLLILVLTNTELMAGLHLSAAWVAGILAVLNILNRWLFTTGPVSLTGTA